MDIKRELKKIKRKFKTMNPLEIAEKLDVVICDSFLPDKLRGFFQISNRVIIIYLNNRLSEIERRIVFAHELAHALLHRGMNRIFMDSRFLNVPNRYENEANLLAAYMLISDDDISEYISHEYTVGQIADMTGIDEVFIKKRIEDYLKNKE